jgi:hypothetical protein
MVSAEVAGCHRTGEARWFAPRQLSGGEPGEADVYSFYWRPSTTCVARSVAVDFMTW